MTTVKFSKIFRALAIVACVGAMLFSGWKVYTIWREYHVGETAYEDLASQYVETVSKPDPEKNDATKEQLDLPEGETMAEEVPTETAPISVSFDALLAQCKDVVGWIYCPDTPINYPIVQSRDNRYYLRRLLNGEYNHNGTLFMDFRNQEDFSDWNSIVYGHNMQNEAMFGILPYYARQSYYEAHPQMYLLTPGGDYKIVILGGYTTPADAEAYDFLDSREQRDALIEKTRQWSDFVTDVQPGEGECLITLSTCVYDYADARYVLVGLLRPLADRTENQE